MGVAGTVAFQPVKIADAVIAEFLQGGVADHALGFVLEVVKHRLGAVVETCGLLMPGAAPGVDHPTAFGTGAAAGKAVGHDHPGAIAAGLQRSAGTRHPPTDHQHVAGVVPVPCTQALGLQGREDFAVAAGSFGSTHDSARTLALAVAGTLLAI